MRTGKRATVGTLLGIWAALALPASSASAAVAHTVQPGETLSGVAAANGITADALAAYNGMSASSYLIAGETIEVPYPGEVASPTSSTTTTTTTYGAHTVAAGESLFSIAAANGVSPYDLAAANGLSIDSTIVPGQTLQLPAATSTPTTTATTTSTSTAPVTTTTSSAPASGLSPIYCPCGTDYLATPAADEWNAMRQDALSTYGVDIYPAGPLSAYRTYAQQAYLYQQYLNGTGAPANPPGTSPHQLGDSVDVATPEMRSIVDSIGSQFGWGKIYGPTEWWHVDYLGG